MAEIVYQVTRVVRQTDHFSSERLNCSTLTEFLSAASHAVLPKDKEL